ncbi:46475_t:CDS:2 [Gigaspora margarita]|uniref:46475_t:CDS:1 n=1 Tax=Gigaspora margarita TaxID=4874 RepID=A0ABM8W6F6_GIGMA|nr:46475_t:CDS:2 [Gigaspora margarita]
MKFQSFYLTIFFSIHIILSPTIEAYTTDTFLDMYLCRCRIWVEDSNHNRIAGDGPGHYHDCDGDTGNGEQILNFANVTFWVHAKVQGSLEKKKVRGPFNTKCFDIYGRVGDWKFDETSC